MIEFVIPPDADLKQAAPIVSKGNREAADFILLIGDIAHFWDDLIDKDKPIDDAAINYFMWQILIELPRNRFYAANFAELNPILAISIHNWMAANSMEDHSDGPDERDLEISFIIRSSYCDLITQTAIICGGFEWGLQMAPQIRRACHKESFEGYRQNLLKQRVDADKLRKAVNVL